MKYEKCKTGKALVNTANFPTSFGRGRAQRVCCLYDFQNHGHLLTLTSYV